MTDFRQKRDGAAASDAEFCRGLEELFRGHLDGCMSALASCSSARGVDSDDDDSATAEGSDLLARRRRRSEIDGDDLAESSAARRRHSRILSRWVARQAEEMITTMERRNRESELMALAGLHTVSMLDSSFLREPRRSTSSVVERPGSARAFSILQRWRELEDEAGRRERRGLGDGRVEERQDARMDASESDENEYRQWTRGEGMTPIAPQQDGEDDNRSSREQSPDLGEVERERVRQIVRGWITERGLTDHGAPITPQRNESPRAEWLGETERERVRLVREWVQMASEQRDARAGRQEERERDRDPDRDREGEHGSRDSSVTDHEDGQPEHVRRDLLRIRGRQARLDLIMRVAMERQRELQGLSEHRAVSEFAHRSRIQSFLRGRFLRNGRTPEDERPPSVAARELGQLRQRHPVSGLREGFRYRLESIVRSQASNHSETSTGNQNVSAGEQSQLNAVPEAASGNNEQSHHQNEENDIHRMEEIQNIDLEENANVNIVDQLESTNQEGRWLVENMEHDRGDWEQTTEVGVSEWNGQHREDSVGNWHERIDQEWPQEVPEIGIGEGSGSPEAHEDWREDESNLTAEQWQDDNSEPSRSDQPASIRRVNTFIPPDDDNVYSTELRELLSRRSVSNLLSSGFRESLDQLIQSYVQRQGRGPMDWNLPQNVHNPELPEEVRDVQRYDPGRNQQDAVPRAPRVLPVPPVPPPQPIWHQDTRHSNWTRNNMHRSEIECDVINDLRADMARLQQGMNHMQRMLEACMDMQLELQRSVRQEVSAALNRNFTGQGDVAESSDGSKWSHVRKGTCCVCCDAQIDSLLYRCGHMCTCSRCANELVRSGGKCPLCRAPIVEVIRAYCIL